MTIDIASAEASLIEEREKLLHQLHELGAGEVDYGDAFADAAAATAERTEVLGLVETLKRLLEDVDAALVRIGDGTYGICADCGKQIGVARMEFRPTSRLCVDCKSNT